MKKLISVLTVLALMLCLLPVSALAADTVTLNIADGSIVISATGYSIDGGAETAYTGSYIITGSANTTGPYKTLTVNGVAEGSEVTLKDLEIITSGPSAITLAVPVKATGKLTLAASAPAISGNNITITGDADIYARMTGGTPVISATTAANITCRSMDIEAGMAFSASSTTVNASGNIKLKTSYPCISANSVTVEAGGDITMVGSSSPTVTTNTLSMKAGGNLTLQNETNCAVSSNNATLSAGGNITISNAGSAPAISGTELAMTATSGDITVTNTAGGAISISACDISAGGKLTIQGADTTPAFIGGFNLAQKLQAKGDVTVSSSGGMAISSSGDVTVSGANVIVKGAGTSPALSASSLNLAVTGNVDISSSGGMAISSSGDVTVSGANVTVKGAGTSPALSASSLNLAATGNVTITTGHIAASANGDIAITADGNIKVSGTGTVPLVSSGQKATVKAKGTVELTNANYGIAISSGDTEVEGSSVTVSTGSDAPVMTSKASLKATTGNLNVASTATGVPLFYGTTTLYAAKEINLKTASNYISEGVPEITFGKHFNAAAGNGASLFIGLNRVAVADGTNYLPLLQMKVNGQQIKEAVFTAKSGDKAVTTIKDAGTYACGVSVPTGSAGADVARTEAVPFNLLVRKAKPAVTPSTGDNTQLGLLMVLTIASAASLAGVYFSRKRFTR